MDPLGMRFVAAQWQGNNLFVYPAHHDYRHGLLGDLLPANTPGLLTSLGSSGSDQALLRALMLSLGAMPPESRKLLETKGLVSPILSWLLRRSLRRANDAQVIDGKEIDLDVLLRMAREFTPDHLPAVPRLSVQDESPPPQAGVDFFDENLSGHALASTACAVSRVFRSRADAIHLTLDLSHSLLPKGLSPSWSARVINGPADAVDIQGDAKANRITLRFVWCRPFLDAHDVLSSRVDVAITSQGAEDRGPAAIVSVWMSPQQWRLHDNQGRLLEIDHATAHPAVGLPDADQLEAWLRLLFAAAQSHEPKHLRHQLLGRVLSPVQALAIGAVQQPLEKLRREWAASQGAGEDQRKTELLREKLQQQLNNALQRPLDKASQGPSLRRVLHQSLERLALDPHWLGEFREQIKALAAETGSLIWMNQEASRAQALDLLTAQEASRWQLQATGQEQDRTQRLRQQHAMEGLNRCALAHVVFAGILQRPQALAWTDPRLATAGAWRDVFTRDAKGQIIGWQRHQQGRVEAFDAEGRWLGSPSGQALRVRYQRDAQQQLRWEPAP